MTQALFKKQILEVFSWIYQNRKNGKRRSLTGMLLYCGMYLLIFCALAAVFYVMADALCMPLLEAELGWIYWCLMGMIAIVMGVFGSVFNTYASLYMAKDNDLLLSLPVPPSRILIVRLSGVYAMGLMYELIVAVPMLIVWFLRAEVSASGVICALLMPLLLSLLVLVLSALLGWAVAMTVARLKHKNLMAVLASLAFIAAYYYVYARAYGALQLFLGDAQAMGERLKAILYPLYHMGRAAEGSLSSMLIFSAAVLLLLALCGVVLSRSFLRLTSAQRGGARAVGRMRRAKQRSISSALLQKELRRFLGSSNYMLNCGLGVVLMPLAAIVLIWKADMVRGLAEMFSVSQAALMAAGAVCTLTTLCDISAPSISLEGANLWILRSLPLSPRQVLRAKLKLHLLLALIPALPLWAVLMWILRPAFHWWMLTFAAIALFVFLQAALGLAVNLKLPNLNWSSEIVPIKQGASVAAVLFGSWALVGAFAGLYLLLRGSKAPAVFLLLICLLIFGADWALLCWLHGRGAKRFEEL